MSKNILKKHLSEGVEFITNRVSMRPQIALILGSGLGNLADSVAGVSIVPTKDIPHYPVSTVPGHSGRWVFGKIAGTELLVVQGRVHFYEGYSLQKITYPIHLIASLGVRVLILTTASGGINPGFKAGDIMLITDHINLGFRNPLIGPPDQQLGARFPDLSEAYNKKLLNLAAKIGAEQGVPFRKGVFCWVTGPAYETAAEVRMMRILGADAASMSTVPEVIVANQRHLMVLGMSLITNSGTGISSQKLSHEDVTKIAGQMATTLVRFFRAYIPMTKSVLD